jgi:selenide,water dikinase
MPIKTQSAKSESYPYLFMISSTDYFYPSVDDPFIQGQIGACNVLSDLYAMGVCQIDSVLMILASSLDMEPNWRDIVTRKMIEGFSELCKRAGVEVTGGQTVFNPWPIIGGTAMSCCSPNEFIMPVNARAGDVLVLTKPLGTQVAVNVNVWLQCPDRPNWEKAKAIITLDQAYDAYNKAIESMTRLNLNAAKLMHKYGAHAATDVTGFGLIGHARNLAKNQKSKVHFIIHTLPLIQYMDQIDTLFGIWNLLAGLSAETSGGLLIALEEDKAKSFCSELEELDHQPAWIIGKVIDSQEGTENEATIIPNKTIVYI